MLIGTTLALVVLAAPAAAGTSSHALKSSFGNGTWRVGINIAAGTYRTRQAPTSCYWERLSGFSGDFDDIIANDFSSGYQVVTINPSDMGFKSSRCGKWTSNLSRVTTSTTSFGQGTFIVGTDMDPGTYQSSKGKSCYWERLSGFSGEFDDIIANDFLSGGRAIVTIEPGDVGFHSSRCGTWKRI